MHRGLRPPNRIHGPRRFLFLLLLLCYCSSWYSFSHQPPAPPSCLPLTGAPRAASPFRNCAAWSISPRRWANHRRPPPIRPKISSNRLSLFPLSPYLVSPPQKQPLTQTPPSASHLTILSSPNYPSSKTFLLLPSSPVVRRVSPLSYISEEIKKGWVELSALQILETFTFISRRFCRGTSVVHSPFFAPALCLAAF
jgi:hypothetical protein